jgi:hypothetical protein
MKNLFIFGIFVLTCVNSFAQTYHSGTISTDETWLAADNPHICTGDITISSTEPFPVLTLEPGVIVKFDAGVRMYVGYTSSSSLGGGLIAVGTETEPIIFTSNAETPAPGDWDYIQFRRFCIEDKYELENVVIEYGGSSLENALLIDNNPVIVNNSIFRNNQGSGMIFLFLAQATRLAGTALMKFMFTENPWLIPKLG